MLILWFFVYNREIEFFLSNEKKKLNKLYTHSAVRLSSLFLSIDILLIEWERAPPWIWITELWYVYSSAYPVGRRNNSSSLVKGGLSQYFRFQNINQINLNCNFIQLQYDFHPFAERLHIYTCSLIYNMVFTCNEIPTNY